MAQNDIEQMAAALKAGFEEKDSAPTPTITPDNKTTVVVGNPNEVAKKKVLPYQLVFSYRPDEIQEEDKEKMVYVEETDEYAIGVEYKNVRVRPLNRTKVAALFLDICLVMGIVSESGITTGQIEASAAVALIDQFDKVAQLAQLILGLDDNQVMHINPGCLFDFFVTLLRNEPNLKHEGNNFLSYSAFQKKKSSQAKN